MLRSLGRRLLSGAMRGRIRRWMVGTPVVSSSHELVCGEVPARLSEGFRHREVAERQQQVFAPLLREMREGRPRADFSALAQAVRLTGLEAPRIVEVGCGSGWNSEVLDRLLGMPVEYVGVDYSEWMIELARRSYPRWEFVIADATDLPFADGSFDIVVSGTVLMHVLDYRGAIRESRRVAGRSCIFHTVPVVQQRDTTVLRKLAYGREVVEVVFNEASFRGLLEAEGLRIAHVLDSIPYDLRHVLDEPSVTKTYVCEIALR